MLQCIEEQEVYMRFWRSCQKFESFLRKDYPDLNRRNQPAVVRKDEVLRGPHLTRSREYLASFLYLIYKFPDADYQIKLCVLDKALGQAKYRNYEGEWGIWLKMKDYFGLPDLPGEENTDRKPSIPVCLQNERPTGFEEGSIFSPYYFIEFLLNFYCSEDDLFGNIVSLTVRLGITYRVENFEQISRREQRRPVRRAQRHRGYRDKGSCSSESEKARRQANQSNDESRKITIDTLAHVTTWGRDYPPPEENE